MAKDNVRLLSSFGL